MSPRSDRHDTTVTLPRMREGTAHLLRIVDDMGDEAFAQPGALPGCDHTIGPSARRSARRGRRYPSAEQDDVAGSQPRVGVGPVGLLRQAPAAHGHREAVARVLIQDDPS